MLEKIDLKDAVTVGLAAVGAVLGVMNTWNSLNARRVRLRVRPLAVIKFGAWGDSDGFAIEVINLSAFPVVVSEVGFTRKILSGGKRYYTPGTDVHGRDPLPHKVGSREAVTVYFDLQSLKGLRIGKAYANTACGVTRYGRSPALRGLRKSSLE